MNLPAACAGVSSKPIAIYSQEVLLYNEEYNSNIFPYFSLVNAKLVITPGAACPRSMCPLRSRNIFCERPSVSILMRHRPYDKLESRAGRKKFYHS